MPAGWKTESVRVLGAKRRAGGKHLRLGRRSQIRGVTLPDGSQGVLVVNEIGDVRAYSNLPGEVIDENLAVTRGDGNAHRIGYSATGVPDYFQYAAALPRDDGAWDLLMSNCRTSQLHIARRVSTDALQFGEIETLVDLPRNEAGFCPVPEIVDGDLLLAHPDGSVTRRRGPNFDGHDEPVLAGGAPIELDGPLFISAWDDDLLIGTGEGNVMRFRSIGDGQYDRGRRLHDARGFVQVKGPACPTVINDTLLVVDGEGGVWSWPIKTVDSYVTTPDMTAFGITRDAYEPAQWWRRAVDGRTLLCAGPHPPRPAREKGQRTITFDDPAPPLCIASPIDGPGEVHVTFYKPDDVHEEMVAEIKLDSDARPTVLRGCEYHAGPQQDVFFKAADLTGAVIELTQQVGALTRKGGLPVCIESVRIVPVKAAPKPKPRRKHVPISGIFDAVMYTLDVKCDTPQLIEQVMGMHRDAGFDWMYYKLGGGTWEYPSNVPGARSVVPDPGIPGLAEMSDADRAFCAERIEIQEGINWIELGAKACHKHGMKFFGWHRVQNHGERLHGKGPLDQFYVDHPEYLEKNVAGKPIPGKICLAYPEVRDYQVAICAEAMDLGADGIMVETLRHLPKACYGDPVVERFRDKYGLDMRELPPFDERVMAIQNEVFTEFLRQVKQTIRAKQPDAELHVRVCKPYPLAGCDPRTWAEEGIVDEIIIEHRAPCPKRPDIEGMVATCRGTDARAGAVFARTRWGREPLSLHPYRIDREVADYLKAGARSISFYETARVIDRPEYCRAIRRINDGGALPSVLV